MCNTAFINFLSNCLSTVIDKVDMKIKSIDGCDNVNIMGNSLNENNILNVGAIQSGQPQNIIFRTTIDDINNFKIKLDFDYNDTQLTYVIDNSNNKSYDISKNSVSIKPEIYSNQTFTFDQKKEMLLTEDMIYQIPKIMLIDTITSGISQPNLQKTCASLDELCNIIENIMPMTENSINSIKLNALLKNIKHPDLHEGQIYKAFSRQDWFENWGVHYLKYFVRSHQLQVCSNFKDASLQLYGGQLFKELRTEVENIFSQIPVPKPSLSSNAFMGNFTKSFYSSSNPCFDGYGQVKLLNGGIKLVKDLQKGDKIINSDGNSSTIICVIKTTVKKGNCDMVMFNNVKVTPWHPVRIINKWNLPCDIKEPMPIYCDYVYSFVLDKHHIMTVNNIDIITLGHNFIEDPVISHSYFGTNKVMDDLKTQSGWDNGLIEIIEYKPTRDKNGLVISLFSK